VTPKIKFLDVDGKVYRFQIDGITPTYLNAIRRIITYGLPIYAIDDIDFYENDSVTVDEMLANRIGLCPIITPLASSGKKVTFNLDKTGPCTVYSKDLVSLDPEIKCVYDTIPLTKLKEGEKLKLDAFATLGTGATHTKYSPAIVSYIQLQDLEVLNNKVATEYIKEHQPPENCIQIVSGKPVLKSSVVSGACAVYIEQSQNSLKLIDTDNYILNIELIGQISIQDLLELFIRTLKEYVSVLKKKIK